MKLFDNNKSLLNTNYLKIKVQNSIFVLLFGTLSTFATAQTERVISEFSGKIAPLSYDEAVMRSIATTNYTSSEAVTYKGIAGLGGNYTVGAGGDYATLTAAVSALNSGPIDGPVTFLLTDSNYDVAETFPIIISRNVSSSTKPITIKPTAGQEVTISGSASVLLKIDAADYITIDGSNNGTNSQNLIFHNTATANNPAAIWFASNTVFGANYNTVKNTKFLGANLVAAIAGIVVSGPILGTQGTVPNNYLRFENNIFNRFQNGIFAIGPADTNDEGLSIIQNMVGSPTLAEGLGFRGIAVQNTKNFLVNKNTIMGVNIVSTSTAVGLLIGGEASNGIISQNQISNIRNSNPSGYGAAGVQFNIASTSGNNLFRNNFISNVFARGYNLGGISDNGNGIVISDAGTSLKILHNTVALNTNQVAAGRPAAINILSTVTRSNSIDLRNNIFVNRQTQAGEKYTIYSGAPNTVFSAIDYNNYFSSGDKLGFIGSGRSTLADLQIGFDGNSNSVNIAPIFVSETDLHLTSSNGNLNNLGTPLAEVTLDIDDEVRSSSTPDIGADEFGQTLATTNQELLKVSFYPNPVTDYLHISNTEKIGQVTIYNTAGQKVAAAIVNSNTGRIDMRILPTGMYLVRVETGKKIEVLKVLKK